MAVEGMEELGRKLRELAQTNLTQATAQAIEIVRSVAVLNCHEDTGELRQSIHTEVRQNGDTVQGICYTNKTNIFSLDNNILKISTNSFWIRLHIRKL